MKKFISRLVSFIALLTFVYSTFIMHYSILALEETEDLDISKTLEVNETLEGRTINIVFSIPVVAQTEEIDIVLVLDNSFADSEMRAHLKSMIDALNMFQNAKFNIAVINFNLDVTDRLGGLVRLDDTSIDTIKSAISNQIGAGTNLHGALIKGQELLDSSSTFDENKYLVLASDFAGNKLDSGDGKGRVLFIQEGSRYVGFGDPVLFGTPHYSNNHDFDYKYNKDDTIFFQSLTVNHIDDIINNKKMLSGNIVEETDPNHKYLVEVGDSVGEYYPDLIRVSGDKNLTDEQKATIVTSNKVIESTFPSMNEKIIYHTGNILKSMKESGYNIYAYTKKYETNLDPGNRFEIIADLYQNWFEDNIGVRYHKERGDTVVDMVNNLADTLLYQKGKGQIVDVVDSRFKVIKEQNEVLINNNSLPVSKLNDDHYVFGNKDSNDEYPYELVYSKDASSNNDIVTWYINEPANNFDLLQLKFAVRLKEIPNELGNHLIPTNESARIDYVSTKELKSGTTDYTKTQSIPTPHLNIDVGSVLSVYVDQEGNELETSELLIGEVGEMYNTQEKVIAGYELIEVKGNSTSFFEEDAITVTYIYEKADVPIVERESVVTVNYVDEGGNQIHSSIIITGTIGERYSTTQLEIDGYEFVRVEGNSTGLFEENDISVTYVYKNVDSNASLPSAGMSNTSVYLSISAIILGISLVAFAKKRKEN